MKKATAAILGAVAAMTILSACGSGGTAKDTAAAPQTEAVKTEAPAEKKETEASEAPKTALKAAFITPQALGDGSVTDLSYSGFTKAAEEYGMDTQVVEVQVGEYEETLRSMKDTDCWYVSSLRWWMPSVPWPRSTRTRNFSA